MDADIKEALDRIELAQKKNHRVVLLYVSAGITLLTLGLLQVELLGNFNVTFMGPLIVLSFFCFGNMIRLGYKALYAKV